jgi:hypothetical protein
MYRALRGSRMAGNALLIVQLVTEVTKPDGERLPAYRDSQMESLKFRLFSPAPVYAQLEEATFGDALQESLDQLGSGDPFVKTVLNGRSPADVAHELITGTKMADPAFRRGLVEGGEKAVAASTDPMIMVARKVDPIVRELRTREKKEVEGAMTAASERLGKARFAVYGKDLYPDATFTLRLAYGPVVGYPMNGTQAQPMTTFHGLYDRAYGFSMKPPYDLPVRYLERKDRMELSTPLNFVCAADVVGGSSGSPVLDREGRLVGLVFDGNIESLVGDVVYNEANNRTVAVHSEAIVHALRALYDAAPLADELEGIRGK